MVTNYVYDIYFLNLTVKNFKLLERVVCTYVHTEMILPGKKSNSKLIFRNESLNPHIFFVYKRYKEKSQQYIRKAKLYKNMIWIFYIRGKSWVLYRIGTITLYIKKVSFQFF